MGTRSGSCRRGRPRGARAGHRAAARCLALGTGLALLLAIAACTEPNPGFHSTVGPEGGSGGCGGLQRRCVKQFTQVCAANGQWLNERICPPGAGCESGICVPTGTRCTDFCPAGQTCTLFVDPADPAGLATYCAEPLGWRSGGSACATNEECQSGFCLTRAGRSFCFRACTHSTSCQKATLRCLPVVMSVNGVQDEVQTCAPST